MVNLDGTYCVCIRGGEQVVYQEEKCIVVIENLEIKGITHNQQDPPSPEEIKNILNKAVREMTQQVSAEFGF